MISIGQRLSDQRRRRGLTLEDCEAATHIRGRHLMALEEDRADDIGDVAYARLFLRGYATFLGLDGSALVKEYDERRGAASPLDEHRVVPLELGPAGRFDDLRRWLVRPRRRSRRRELAWVAVGLIGALAVATWVGARSGPAAGPPQPPAAHVAASRTVTAGPAAAPAAPHRVRLVLTGTGTAGSWVRVVRGTPNGPLAWEGTLAPAQRVRLPVGGTLWMRVGWAPSLQVTLGGRAVPLTGGTGDYVVTRDGVAPAS